MSPPCRRESFVISPPLVPPSAFPPPPPAVRPKRLIASFRRECFTHRIPQPATPHEPTCLFPWMLPPVFFPPRDPFPRAGDPVLPSFFQVPTRFNFTLSFPHVPFPLIFLNSGFWGYRFANLRFFRILPCPAHLMQFDTEKSFFPTLFGLAHPFWFFRKDSFPTRRLPFFISSFFLFFLSLLYIFVFLLLFLPPSSHPFQPFRVP